MHHFRPLFLRQRYSTLKIGVLLASEIEAASASFICHFLHFPDQFSRDPDTPATFNDYQLAATQLGVSFGKAQEAIKSL